MTKYKYKKQISDIKNEAIKKSLIEFSKVYKEINYLMVKTYSKIYEIINDAKKGKMFILVDDENRENEVDLIIPASKITPHSINFMAKFITGMSIASENTVNYLNYGG